MTEIFYEKTDTGFIRLSTDDNEGIRIIKDWFENCGDMASLDFGDLDEDCCKYCKSLKEVFEDSGLLSYHNGDNPDYKIID